MKKILSLLLAAMTVLAIVSCGGTVQQVKTGEMNGFKYNIYSNYLEITEYVGTAIEGSEEKQIDKNVVIPSAIEINAGKDPINVTSIANGIFDGKSVETVKVPSTVTKIAAYAFAGCPTLQEINVSEDSGMFCSVEGVLFSKDKTKLLYYPDGKTAESFTIPDTVSTVSNGAFANTPALKEIKISEAHGVYKTVDGILFSKDGKTLIAYPAGKEGTAYTVAKNVTEIANWAFNGAKNLEVVTIPAKSEEGGITALGYGVFADCKALKEVHILGNSIETVSDMVFMGCPDTLKIIAEENTAIHKYAQKNNINFEKANG